MHKSKLLLSLFVFSFTSLLTGETISYPELLETCTETQRTACTDLVDALCQEQRLDGAIQFTMIDGGLTSARVFSFEWNGAQYVLRFLNAKQSEELRQGEVDALRVAHRLGIAPRCSFVDDNTLVAIMPFVQGHRLSRDDLENPAVVVQLGKTIRRLHSYSGEYPVRRSMSDRLGMHYRKGIDSDIALPSGFGQMIEGAIREAKSCCTRVVPCHGDLNPSNILVEGDKVTIIDWTTATLDDPLSDLGYLSLLTNMSSEQEEIFLESYYGGAPTEQEMEQMEGSKARVALLTAAIWFRFAEGPEEMKLPYKRRVLKLDRELESPSLKRAEEYLAAGEVVNLRTASKESIRSYALAFYKAYTEYKGQEALGGPQSSLSRLSRPHV